MILKYKSFVLMSLLSLLGQAITAQTYCLSYEAIREGKNVDITVRLKAGGSAFNLGACNLQFKYSTATLSKPTLLNEVLSATTAYNGITVTQPMPPSFAKTSDGLASINFNFIGATGTGLPISKTGTKIAVVRFEIEDANQSPNLRPYDQGSVGTIVYNDNATHPLLLETTGNCPVYNTLIPTQETPIAPSGPKLKVYPNLLTMANSVLTLEVLGNTNSQQQYYHIFNILGEEVRTGQTGERIPINVDDLPTGTYIVKVDNEQVKFIKE